MTIDCHHQNPRFNRPFPPASGQRKYIIIGVDYFTKWVEAEPLATITEHQMKKFVWKNLVTRFGLPKAIITDNGPQFAGRRFREFCAGHGIQLKYSSVAHPQTNGLVEVTNRSILDGLKRRVSTARSVWTDELPSVLWSLRTTPKTATGESPYSLTFGTEAVLPPSGRGAMTKKSRAKDFVPVSTCSRNDVLTRT